MCSPLQVVARAREIFHTTPSSPDTAGERKEPAIGLGSNRPNVIANECWFADDPTPFVDGLKPYRYPSYPLRRCKEWCGKVLVPNVRKQRNTPIWKRWEPSAAIWFACCRPRDDRFLFCCLMLTTKILLFSFAAHIHLPGAKLQWLCLCVCLSWCGKDGHKTISHNMVLIGVLLFPVPSLFTLGTVFCADVYAHKNGIINPSAGQVQTVDNELRTASHW